MFKKLSALLVAIAMVVTVIALDAFAAEPRKFLFERVDAEATDCVKVNVTNNTSEDAAAIYIIAVYTDEEDKITAISASDATAVAKGATETIEVSIEDMSAASVLSYYVWDGVELRTPLENGVPVPPTEITSPAKTLETIDLEWNAGDDDYHGVTSYNVYNGGMFVGNTQERSFTDINRERGVYNDYTVKAVDDEGFESAQAVAATMIANDIPTAICAGDEMITDGRVQYIVEESYGYYGATAAAEEDGLMCRRTVNPSQDGLGNRNIITRHPFKFSTEYAQQIADEPDLTFILTYYDDARGLASDKRSISMDYNRVGDGPDSLYTAANMGNLTDTKQWKTLVKRVTNCNFGLPSGSSGNSYCKLRIYSLAKDLHIYSLSVLPTSQYEALLKEATGRVTDAFINNGVSFNDKAEGVSKTKIADKGAVLLSEGTVLECDVNKAAVTAASEITVEIDYFTETENEEIVFTYGASSEISQKATAKGKWQRMKFTLTDASFAANAITGTQLEEGADFTIASLSGAPLYIHAVRAYIPR